MGASRHVSHDHRSVSLLSQNARQFLHKLATPLDDQLHRILSWHCRPTHIYTTPAWKRSGLEEAKCIRLRRSGTRVSLLVLAILSLRSLLCYLPHSIAPRDTCVLPSSPAKDLDTRTRRCCWACYDCLHRWLLSTACQWPSANQQGSIPMLS